MDCRRFRQYHVEFVDDTLPAVTMVAMRRHLRVCPACTARDTKVRRGLLLVRNQPDIQPSPEFRARLAARLREVTPFDLEAPADVRVARTPSFWRPQGAAGFFSAGAGLVAAGLLAFAVAGIDRAPATLALPPVVATIPEPEPAPLADPMLLASLPSGMTVWPAVLMAEQAPMHFAGSEFQLTSWGR